MPGHAKMLVRPPPILVTDVALAQITRHDEDFLGWPKNPGAAPCHMILSFTRNGLDKNTGDCPFHDRRAGRRMSMRAKADKPKKRQTGRKRTSPRSPYTGCATAAGFSCLLTAGAAVQTLRFVVGRRRFDELADNPLTSP
jgi:hypothetical protein